MHLHWQLVSRSATGTGSPSHIIPFRPHPIHHHHYGCPLALGLARLYPSVRQHILNQVQNNKVPDPSDINDRFESLIETPLSTLNDVPVIVIDGLDECGGLRHDASAKDDNKDLLYTLKRWAQVNHLKRFKLIITSRPEDHTSRIFPESISRHIAIPSGSDVKLGDSASRDIHAFLESRLNDMDMKPALIANASAWCCWYFYLGNHCCQLP